MDTEKSIGIKQVIRLEWLQKAADSVIAGMSEKDIRSELEEYLKDKSGSGAALNRAEYTKSIAVSLLMNTWVSPRKDLIPLRDAALDRLKNNGDDAPVCHWLMYAGAYPFWFNICGVFGSLFSLQNQIIKKQIMSRIYEVYGERSTIERCSRYAIRTLAAWGLVKDQGKSGTYEKYEPKTIESPALVSLILESALHVLPERKSSLTLLMSSPAFFPFRLPQIDGGALAQENPRLVQEQLDQEYIGLRT
ncbi:MAG: hypothetical protein LBG73_02010 [Spirochaetaceae bacterium]|jgi:hypothetical protein|nr:hypothetical protein [Spirochaetaceae bacterium]